MKSILLSLAAVVMLSLLATPAMADHRHHRGCAHWRSPFLTLTYTGLTVSRFDILRRCNSEV